MDSDGRSLLYIAASQGEEKVVELLLARKADPNTSDKENRTPLYVASEKGYLRICETLFEKSEATDIHLSSKSGKTPLYVAAEKGHALVCRFLLQNGANVRQETFRGKIALYAAAEGQFVQTVRELLPYTEEQVLSPPPPLSTTQTHFYLKTIGPFQTNPLRNDRYVHRFKTS